MTQRCLGLAFILICALSTACASGSSGMMEGGRRTETTGFTSELGGAASFELTTEAAVRDTVISATRSAVWSALPFVFETLEIETPTVDPRTLLIGNTGYRAGRIEGKRLSTYMECGRGIGRPNADQYDVTLQLMVQLQEAPGGGTVVRTTMDAYARSRAVTGNSIHCTSRGTLERRIVELVREGLTGA